MRWIRSWRPRRQEARRDLDEIRQIENTELRGSPWVGGVGPDLTPGGAYRRGLQRAESDLSLAFENATPSQQERLYAAITAVREAAGLGREVEGRDA